jgi:hypothetical protein
MHRLAVLCLLLAGCASTPKSWTPTQYSPPPGVTATIWEECWKREEANARKHAGSRYDSLTPKQKRCLVMRLATSCVFETIAMLQRAAPEIAARCSVSDFEDFMVDAEFEQCGDHEGGANEVLDLFIYINDAGRGRSGALNKARQDYCPAN